DVRAYFAQNMPQAAAGANPAIIKVEFVTASQVNTQTGGAFQDRPGDVTVCYVLLKGPFDFVISQPPAPPGVNVTSPDATPKPINYVEYVFDAYSGNLLMWGI